MESRRSESQLQPAAIAEARASARAYVGMVNAESEILHFLLYLFRGSFSKPTDQLPDQPRNRKRRNRKFTFSLILSPFSFRLSPFAFHTLTGFPPLPVLCLPSVLSVFGSVFVITYQKENRRRGHPTSPAFDFLLLASCY